MSQNHLWASNRVKIGRILLAAAVLLLSGGLGTVAVFYEGEWQGSVEWNIIEENLALLTTLCVTLNWSAALTSTGEIRFTDQGLDRLTLGSLWRVTPHRWRWRLRFSDGIFDEVNAEWRYRRSPWTVTWRPELKEGEPFTWNLRVSYAGDPLSGWGKGVFTNGLNFTEFTGRLTAPFFVGWEGRWTVKLDLTAEELVQVDMRFRGSALDGDLTLEWEETRLTDWEWEWEWEVNDAISTTFALVWNEEDGLAYTGRISAPGFRGTIRMEGIAPLTLTRLDIDLFGRWWGIQLDFVNQALEFTLSKDISEYTSFDFSFCTGMDEEEKEIGLYWETQNWSANLGISLLTGVLEALQIELALYF